MIALLILASIHASTSATTSPPQPPQPQTTYDPLPGEAASLYDPNEDAVISLNASTMGSIFHRKTAFLVEFYASWCGDCMHTAPHYKALSNETVFWRPVIVPAAINCYDPANGGTCRVYNITEYPTMKFFPPHARQNHPGILVPPHAPTVALATLLEEEMMEYIRLHPGFAYPPNWPRMPTDLANSDTDGGWEQVKEALMAKEVEKVVVIVGQQPVVASIFFARSVVLDLSKFGHSFRFFVIHDAGK